MDGYGRGRQWSASHSALDVGHSLVRSQVPLVTQVSRLAGSMPGSLQAQDAPVRVYHWGGAAPLP